MNTCKHQSINSFMTEVLVLSCSANQWTGFCIIRTSVMKDSRLSSCTQTKSLFLHAKDIIFFFCFVLFCFFYLLFFHVYSRFTGQQVKGEATSFFFFYHFHPLHRHVDISWVNASENSPLCIDSWQPESNVKPLVRAL